jgi:hypothetical protein
MSKLLSPDGVRDFLVRRFNNQHQAWLTGEGAWPLQVSLGTPTEKETTEDPAAVRAWVSAWSNWKGAAELVWEERKWARMGAQQLPIGLVVSSASSVATLVGQAPRWNRANERYARMLGRWGRLTTGGALSSRFNVLADYSELDFNRLITLLEWLDTNPNSNVYLRQLPVEGLDTKWAEQRIGIITGLLKDIRGEKTDGNFHEICGLRKPANRVRIRLLCQELRNMVGGLQDIEAPIGEIAALQIQPKAAVIVENLDTGMALPDMPGTVAVMRLGNAVSALGLVPWLQDTTAVYWGDIDTHGYAILDRARRVLPRLRSALMDEPTVLQYRSLWGHEPTQCSNLALEQLKPHERVVYTALRNNSWGQNVRLEQERLPWGKCVQELQAALSFGRR